MRSKPTKERLLKQIERAIRRADRLAGGAQHYERHKAYQAAYRVRNKPRRRRQVVLWKSKHRTRTRLINKESAARSRSAMPAQQKQAVNARQQQRQDELQQLSLKHMRQKPYRWTKQEEELLSKIYPVAAKVGWWEQLFKIFGRSYIAIRKKHIALKKRA